jgi:hypothetical protein
MCKYKIRLSYLHLNVVVVIVRIDVLLFGDKTMESVVPLFRFRVLYRRPRR